MSDSRSSGLGAPSRASERPIRTALFALGELFKHHLKQRLQYRTTFWFSLLLHPLVMLLVMFMFRGVYSHRQQSNLLGYSLGQMVWYFGASQFFYYLVWNIVDKNMSERVIYGTMDQQLVRPYSLFTWELVQLGAHKLHALAFEFLPVFLLYALIWRPEFLTASGVFRYGVLTLLAALQFFAMSFALGVLAFSWQDVSAFGLIKAAVVNLFAGVALPIAFFPRALQSCALALPFHYLFHTPVSYLLGTAPDTSWAAFGSVLVRQLGWTIGFVLVGLGLYRRSVRRFVSAGG